MIPSLPHPPDDDGDTHTSDPDTESSVGDAYLPPIDPPTGMDDDLDISDALQSVSRSGSPVEPIDPTPRKKYDYSISLKSEPRVSVILNIHSKYIHMTYYSPRHSTNSGMYP